MGYETGLLVTSLVVAAVSSAVTISQSMDAAHAAAAAKQQNDEINERNLQNRAQAINATVAQENTVAVREKSDMMARADAQLGSLTVIAGEMGTAPETANAFIRQQGYSEGADLSRVDDTYDAQFKQGEAAKRDASLSYDSTAANIANQTSGQIRQANNAMFGSVLGGIGSGLSIGGSYAANQTRLDAINKARTTTR